MEELLPQRARGKTDVKADFLAAVLAAEGEGSGVQTEDRGAQRDEGGAGRPEAGAEDYLASGGLEGGEEGGGENGGTGAGGKGDRC